MAIVICLHPALQRFSERNKLGQGGYGTVFRGVLGSTPVAVKVMAPDWQFQVELGVLSRLHHTHIVGLIGSCLTSVQVSYNGHGVARHL